MNKNELIPHLFRNEYSKIVSVICKLYGLSNIELAQDFVSDSFLKAAETWKLKGIPDNPSAWLYTVSKNNAKDYFKRNKLFQSKISKELKNQSDLESQEIDFSRDNIQDSQLKMLFAVCNPINTSESQIALALRILCGFNIDEITNALLSTKQTINKRLYRAKEKLRTNKIDLSFPTEKKLEARLDNVLHILYLLFNEGYYSSSHALSKDLCIEAMRMLYLLTENYKTNLPKTNALMALFCFQSSRFEARIDTTGQHVLYEDQDTSQWDSELILKGTQFLNRSANGGQINKYHLESLIAFWHMKTDFNENEKWENILHLYNRLLQIEYSPVAALNRTYALSKAKGKKVALVEALKIDLKKNHHYHALLADLYIGTDIEKQKEHLKLAVSLAKNAHEKKVLQSKLNKIEK